MNEKTAVQRYRKRPVVVEAVEFSGSNRREVLRFIYPSMSEDGLRGAEEMALPVVIGTLEGDMTVSPGDYVIKGVQGEFYPCKPGIFAATYEPACGPGESPAWPEDLADASLSAMRAKYPSEPAEAEPAPLNSDGRMADDYDGCVAAITAAMERKEHDNDANGFEAPELIELARVAYDVMGTVIAESGAEVARLRNGGQQLGHIVQWMSRSMEAARIEMLQSGPEKAMQWILNSLPDVDDNPESEQWDGKESATEWLDRTDEKARETNDA